MKREGDPADLRLLVILLRSLRGWNQAELAKAARVDKASISDYEQGRRAPSRRTLERLLDAAGVSSFQAEWLLPILRDIRLAGKKTASPGKVAAAAAAADLPASILRNVHEIAAAELASAFLEVPALAGAPRDEPPPLLKALGERLREESARAQADGTGRGPELAELASRLAELSRPGETSRAIQEKNGPEPLASGAKLG